MNKENKTYSMSIRVSKDELEKLKRAARIEAYSSYSEFVRRTALLEASHILATQNNKEINNEGEWEMPKIIDLFAGLGGIRLGFKEAMDVLGLETECVFSSEIKPYAIKAYKGFYGEDEVTNGDITQSITIIHYGV